MFFSLQFYFRNVFFNFLLIKFQTADLERENDLASQAAADVAADLLNPQKAPVQSE